MIDNQELTSKELDAETINVFWNNFNQSYCEKFSQPDKAAISYEKAAIKFALENYEKSREEQLTATQQKLDVAVEALEKIERIIPIETPDKLGLPLVKICQITLEALNTIGKRL